MTTNATLQDHAAVRLGATEVAALTLDGEVAAIMHLVSSAGSHLVVTRPAHRHAVRDPEFLWIAATELDHRYRRRLAGSDAVPAATRST